MNPSEPLHLFQGYGVELEYMLVDAQSLSVRAVADRLLAEACGEPSSDAEFGPIAWSNELVAHVIELKCNGPAPSLDGLASLFQDNLAHIQRLLAPMGVRLMPSAMHPWMDPIKETRLWPLAYTEVYHSFDRVFGCQGHGWSNLQSVHINLPFADDEEFGRLHAAIRLLLPLMPALAASSPIFDQTVSGWLDSRLHVYRNNSRRIPSITGHVIPEPVFTKDDYEKLILKRIYNDIAPYDPQGVLQHEWLNARGAIARFERNTIEIRVLDIQECPEADLALCAAIIETLKALVQERWTSFAEQRAWATLPLEKLFNATVQQADQALIQDPDYLRLFDYPEKGPAKVADLWAHLIERQVPAKWHRPLQLTLQKGPLARRILRALGSSFSRAQLHSVYQQLCDCVSTGTLFDPS